MGYELNKLMKQYGVSTPGAVSYSGPAAPMVPRAPAELGKEPSEEEQAAYDASKKAYEDYQKDPTAFNEAMRKYGLAQKEYDAYRQQYQNRIAATPMYTDTQFKTGLTGEPVAPTYTATIANPTFGRVPTSLAGKSEQELADYYKRLRDLGYTDPDIRAASTESFGVPKESDWRNLLNRAYPQYRTNIETAYQNIGRGPTNIDDAGYNYWLNQLSTGAVKPENLTTSVYNAANTWMPTTTYDQSLIPKQFDWNYYVNKYPDLGKAGIDTIQEAQRHYALYGRGENRLPYEGYVLPAPAPSVGQTQTTPAPAPAPEPYYDYGSYSHGGSVHGMAQKYGMGGAVQGYSVGGSKRTPRGYESPEDEAAFDAIFKSDGSAETFPVEPAPSFSSRDSSSMSMLPNVTLSSAPTTVSDAPPVAAGTVTPVAPPVATSVTESPATKPVTPPPAAVTPVSPAATDLMGMLGKYLSTESTYGPELAAARKRVTAENAAFADMITNAMKQDAVAPDKSEMYFRLAAAFGSPTKTGHFAENLGMVGKELGEYAKDVRAAKKADQQLRMQLAIKGQELKTQAARDELTTLRGLAGEEMKDKRAIVMEYIKSGRPQSEAGKAAMDAGLTQGTPEFTAFVNKYIDDKIRSGNMLKEAMVAIAAGGLQVRQAAERRQTEAAGKLTAKELDLKSKAEDSLLTIDNAMKDLGQAYELNKNSFDTTLKDRATLAILQETGSKDPKVINTRELMNLLKSAMISSASQKLTGVLSDSDIKLLASIAGLDSKSREERAQILKNAYRALQNGRVAQQKRLNEISQGLYRETVPAPSGDLD